MLSYALTTPQSLNLSQQACHKKELALPLFATVDNDVGDDTIAVTGVTLKMAFDSSDVWGVADLSEIKSERFTSEGSLDLVHRLRRCSDCVLVGRGTVERDDCTLTVRRVPLLSNRPSQPARVILDPSQALLKQELNKEATYKIFHDSLQTLLYHATTDDDGVPSLSKAGAHFSDDVESIALTDNIRSDDTTTLRKYLSPTFIVKDLKKRGIHHVMVEGGPATARTFLEERAVDRAILIRAPFCFHKPLESLISEESMTNAGLEKIGTSTCDGDSVEYWSRPNLPWPTEDLSEWP